MSYWLTRFILFYILIAIIWTVRRYLNAKDRDAWKKEWPVHFIESFSWLFILFKTGYGDENKEDKS